MQAHAKPSTSPKCIGKERLAKIETSKIFDTIQAGHSSSSGNPLLTPNPKPSIESSPSRLIPTGKQYRLNSIDLLSALAGKHPQNRYLFSSQMFKPRAKNPRLRLTAATNTKVFSSLTGSYTAANKDAPSRQHSNRSVPFLQVGSKNKSRTDI